MLSGSDLDKARRMLEGLKGSVDIIVVPNGNYREFEEFARRIAECTDAVNVKVEEADVEVRPAMLLRRGDREIVYNAIPIGEEFEPFLITIKRMAEGYRVEEVEGLEAKIKVFIMPICPHCAKVVETVNGFAVSNPRIRVNIIDVTRFPDLMDRYGITSAPTTVINESIKLTGYLSKDELVEWIRKAMGDYTKDYFITLLNERRLEEIKEIVRRDPEKSKVLAELLGYNDFMVRFGAMVVLEDLYKEDPKLIEPAKDVIRSFLRHEDFRIREDVAMLLGDIGDESDVKFLEELLKDRDEVRTSAMEAIEEIRKRKG